MKKTFKSKNFWTVLSCALILSSLGMLVYAAAENERFQYYVQDEGWGWGWGPAPTYHCTALPSNAIDNNSNRPINANQQTRRCTDTKSQSPCTFRCVNGYQCSNDRNSCVQTQWATPWPTSVWLIFTHFKKDSNGGVNSELTVEEWNAIMDKLQDLIIPPHAVMAFNSSDGCPAWWTGFTVANGRFLRGATSNIWDTWWNISNEVVIQAKNLPAHSHFIRYWDSGRKYWDNANHRAVVVDWSNGDYPRSPGNSSNHGLTQWDSFSYYDVSTAPVWKEWQNSSSTSLGGRVALNEWLNVTNAYVNVVFCEKLP